VCKRRRICRIQGRAAEEKEEEVVAAGVVAGWGRDSGDVFLEMWRFAFVKIVWR